MNTSHPEQKTTAEKIVEGSLWNDVICPDDMKRLADNSEM
jgi:hypothetical protein